MGVCGISTERFIKHTVAKGHIATHHICESKGILNKNLIAHLLHYVNVWDLSKDIVHTKLFMTVENLYT